MYGEKLMFTLLLVALGVSFTVAEDAAPSSEAPPAAPDAPKTPEAPAALTSQPLFICNEGRLVPTGELVKKLRDCNDPKINPVDNTMCIAVCTTDAVGGLKDGIPDKDLFQTMIKTNFPEAVQPTVLEKFDKCFENMTFDKNDKNCTSIAEFSKCGTKAVVETPC